VVRLLSRAGRDRPEPLGRRFQAMWSASTASLVGDRIYLTALPLLAAQLTRDPLAIAMITVSGYLPGCSCRCRPVCWSTRSTGHAC
jgi:hypothetical protein